jgi:hypothetical protein
MCSHEIIDRDDTLMYTKGYNFLLFDFLTKWVLHRTSPGEQPALGSRRRRTAINHQTVRWCTGLSGESSAAKSPLSGNQSTAYG